MNADRCPDKQTLFGYMMGTISESEAEMVDRHLASCPACERTAEALEGLSDTMITALRQPAGGDAYAEGPECGQVLEKLQKLQSGNPGAGGGPVSVAPPKPKKKPRRVTRLGDYELLTKLGQGGMGTVYKARHTRLKRVVALKVLPKNRLEDEVAVARFEREMEAVGRLDHPNIVRAMDAREIDRIRFLVMEYVDGLDLSEVVDRCGPLSIADACETIRQAALGLECSRENGLVHRDVKPSNLMLTIEGQVKVLDLGLAQIQEAETLGEEVTGVGQVMGTPDYISPEQALESHAVDIRTDVYSLGCTLYCLLVGHPPFVGPDYDTPMKKVTGHIRDTVPAIHVLKPDVPKPIARLLEKMLEKDPKRRVASPSEVISALAPFCKGSKLIGLLRQARSQEEQDETGKSRIETGELQASAMIDTSREDLGLEKTEEDSSATAPLDPYHRWLGIPPEAQPANHYGLLGLAPFEDDPEVIRDAAARQMAHVRTYHLGPHAQMSQEILNELGAAKACLINRKKKAAYDAWLRTDQHDEPMDQRKSPEPPPVSEEFLASVERPTPRTRIGWPRLNLPRFDLARFNGKKPPLPVLIAAGTAGLFVFLSVVLYITTGKGTIKIVLSDPKADIEVKVDGDVVEITGPEGVIRLRPGEHELVVIGPNYETVCQSFTVRRGDNPALQVTLVSLPSGESVPKPEDVASLSTAAGEPAALEAGSDGAVPIGKPDLGEVPWSVDSESTGVSSTPPEVFAKDVQIRMETKAQSPSSLVREIILPTGTAWNPDVFEIDSSKLSSLLDDFESENPSVFGSVDQHKWYKYAVYRYRENNDGDFKLNGLAAVYHENDNLVYYAEYRENDLNGLMITWSPQGKLIYCGEYRNNERDGLSCLFQDDSPRLIAEYDDDNLLACVWIDEGEVKSYKKEQVAEEETVRELLTRMNDIQGDTVREYKKTLIGQLVDDRRQRELDETRKIGVAVRKRNHEEIVRRTNSRRAGILEEILIKKKMVGH